MKAELTMSQIYWNKSLTNFFFRKQSEETLIELLESVDDYDSFFSDLDELYEDVDELEEDFYSMSVDELKEKFNI